MFLNKFVQLFLDDSKMKNFTSCFKDQKFLQFFFTRIRTNETGRFQDEFPFVSLCGRERNYLRCDDLPVVFTEILKRPNGTLFSFAHAGDLMTFPFDPESICMLPKTGRIYHPADEKFGGVGLIKSSLAIEFSKLFGYDASSQVDSDDAMPTSFTWDGHCYQLNQKLLEILKALHKVE